MSGTAQGGPLGGGGCEGRSWVIQKDGVFDNFGRAFNNMKFILFCPFLTVPLRTNFNLNVLITQTNLSCYGRTDDHVTLCLIEDTL